MVGNLAGIFFSPAPRLGNTNLAEQSDGDPAPAAARAILIAELDFAARQAAGNKAADLGIGDPAVQAGNRFNRDFLSHFSPYFDLSGSPCNTVQHVQVWF